MTRSIRPQSWWAAARIAPPGSQLWQMFGGVPRPFTDAFSSNCVLDGGYTKVLLRRP